MATDDLSQFDYLGEPLPDEQSDGEPAPQADDVNEPEQQLGASEPATQPAGDEGETVVSMARFQQVNEALRRQEERVDELMRLLLADRMRGEPDQDVDPEVDPEVEATVAPVLKKQMREYEEVLRDHRHQKQMAALEEVSPGITKLWPQIKEEYAKLPPHLRNEFDNMGGAIALRTQVEKRLGTRATSGDAAKRRAHTEAAPAGARSRGREVTAADIQKMTRAEFEAFTESLRGQRHGRAGDDYDSLIR